MERWIDLSEWPQRVAWTIAVVAAAWGIGHVVGALLLTRLTRWKATASYPVTDAAIKIVRARLPRWSLLGGAWVAAGFWALPPRQELLLHNVLFVLIALSATLATAAIASAVVEAYGTALAPAVPATSLTRNIAWGLVVTLGLLVVLNSLGISIAPMLTALGVGGLAVALALQEPLANFFAGLFITLAGQIRVGDYILLDSGQEGQIVDFSWRSTRIRMLANNLVIVPNSKLSQSIVTNYHLPTPDLAVLVQMGVDYASNLQHVERVVSEVGKNVMREVTGGVPEFEPFIRYHTYNDSSIDFTVILRAQQFGDQFLVKHEFIKRLHERFAQEGIVIPFPIRTLTGSVGLVQPRDAAATD